MGTDFLTAKFDQSSLREKYKNYFTPVAKILVGDSDDDLVSKYKVQIDSIQVALHGNEASSATFTVVNVYNMQNHCFDAKIKTALCLGTVVKIELGYESEREDIFHGFIYESAIQFGDIPSMQITAMDVRRLMLDNDRENYAWEQTKHSQIFDKIMEDYGKLKLSVSSDATEAELSKPMVQRGNDLAMVKRLCKASDRRFLVCGGNAYFSKQDSDDPITTLSWGRELLSFSPTPCYVDTVIEVRGNLKGSDEMQVEKRTVKSDKTMKSARQTSSSKIVTLTDIDSLEELKARADREEKILKEKARSGNGSCIGMPVLMPGRYVEIEGLDTDVDGTYYLSSVTHSFGSDGFNSEFTLGEKQTGIYGEFMDHEDEKSGRMSGIVLGNVVENWDSEHPGMVKVEAVLGEETQNNLGWVSVAAPYAGNEFGTYILPEIGSKVLVAFCMGRMESPYVIGSIWNQTNALPAETANENNTVKTVITKGGNRITVSDEEGKERICVRTKGELAIELDDENQKISAGDKDGNNVWTVDAKEGRMTLTAQKEISFAVNGKQMLLLDGNGGKAELKADSIKAEAGQKLQLKGQNTSLEGSSTKIGGQSIKAEAQTSLELKGTASLKAESSGMVELKGSMMKLN